MNENKKYNMRCYLPYYWQYIKHCYTFGGTTGPYHKFDNGETFPRDHCVWPAVTFDELSRSAKHGKDICPVWINESHYVSTLGVHFLRSIMSESLTVSDLSTLFMSEDGIENVFITEEELAEHPAREAILSDQVDMFVKFFLARL